MSAMNTTMTLFYNAYSPNARRALAVARYLNINIETQTVDCLKGAHKAPDYLAINPNGLVPTLKDGDFVLWESNAICQYLAAKAGDTTLWPEDPQAQSDVSRWQCWQLAHLGPATDVFAWENFLKGLMGRGNPDTTALDKATQDFMRYARVLDNQLASRPYITGKELTIADFSLASCFTLAEPSKLPFQSFPNIAGWLGRMNAIDAWKSTEPSFYAH